MHPCPYVVFPCPLCFYVSGLCASMSLRLHASIYPFLFRSWIQNRRETDSRPPASLTARTWGLSSRPVVEFKTGTEPISGSSSTGVRPGRGRGARGVVRVRRRPLQRGIDSIVSSIEAAL
eukprot:3611740-Alexandrium_andersonii.AAC.1